MSTSGAADQIALLKEELADLQVQVDAGDLDSDTAANLRSRYEGELAALESTEATPPESDSASSLVVSTRISTRALLGAVLVGVAIVAIGVLAVVSLEDGTTQGAEGVASEALDDGSDVDLSEISNEQMEEVVAQNPDVIGMRLALARRYFEEGEFDKALDHYFEIPDRERHPEALANVGWMTYLSGRPDVALGYLERALERQPDYLPAQWFIANVLVTLDRPSEAVPLLLALAREPDLPDEIRDGVVALLAQIESQ
ncbi:MAG: tetratricopeptide repeat protein [Acidimicrobiia bacterium]